jgi:selenoprotein W-related protein
LRNNFADLVEEVELIASSGGVYEIAVDGKNIFSKKKLNRFPEEGEIVKLVRECC